MAGIDKTYTSNYKEYKNFLIWAKETVFTCPNGLKYYVYDYVYDFWEENDMILCERPIINSSCSLDYFLIKYCPFSIIQDHMKNIYQETYYEIKEGVSDYDKFKFPEKENRRIVIKRRGELFNRKNYIYKLYKKNKKPYFFISIYSSDNYPLFYNDELKRFIYPNELGYHTDCQAYCCRSIKSLIRKIRKWNIPKGYIIIASSERYIGEDLTFYIK